MEDKEKKETHTTPHAVEFLSVKLGNRYFTMDGNTEINSPSYRKLTDNTLSNLSTEERLELIRQNNIVAGLLTKLGSLLVR
jgi:hypothetical protein